MNLPLLSKDFSLNYSGSLSSISAERLNSQLIVANLIKVVSGKIDSIQFEVKIKNGLSSAKLNAAYRKLVIKKIEEANFK